jgi:uncharacterized lipoprotein
VRNVTVFFLLSVLTACTLPYASNDKQQYLLSKNGAALDVPAPLTAENLSGFYDLPDAKDAHRVSVAPPQVA